MTSKIGLLLNDVYKYNPKVIGIYYKSILVNSACLALEYTIDKKVQLYIEQQQKYLKNIVDETPPPEWEIDLYGWTMTNKIRLIEFIYFCFYYDIELPEDLIVMLSLNDVSDKDLNLLIALLIHTSKNFGRPMCSCAHLRGSCLENFLTLFYDIIRRNFKLARIDLYYYNFVLPILSVLFNSKAIEFEKNSDEMRLLDLRVLADTCQRNKNYLLFNTFSKDSSCINLVCFVDSYLSAIFKHIKNSKNKEDFIVYLKDTVKFLLGSAFTNKKLRKESKNHLVLNQGYNEAQRLRNKILGALYFNIKDCSLELKKWIKKVIFDLIGGVIVYANQR